MSGTHLSKEFFELVKSIGESRSKQEEDQIIMREVQTLKKAMGAQNVTPKQMKEYIIRMIYVEMLGHDASFGHIHAVKMVSTKDLLLKRVGYLGCTLTLHQNHQFMLLMVNTLQTDLRSDNYLEVCMALTVVTKLVNAELIPVLLPLCVKALEHAQANVRKKAVVAIQRFCQIDPSSVAPLMDKVRKVLCDKDPSVMGASLWLFLDVCGADPVQFKDLVPSFVSILKQVTEHRLPRDYDYHRMPAPWIQLCLLQILAILGNSDKQASEGMYEILHEVMKRADVGINVGYAIVYECVRTVTSIYPDNALIEDASKAVSRFVSSDNHNLKYLGITALAAIVQINPKYAVEHQMVVIDCLEDPDETLKRKTLELLFSMTNPANVVMVVDKLTAFLRATTDVYLRTDLVSRITQLAEKYAPNNSWYIHTMNDVFELGGDLFAHNLMRLIAEGGTDGVDADKDIRYYAVTTYLDLLKKPVLPDILMQVIAWVVGEYAYLATNITLEEVIKRLCTALDRTFEHGYTRAWFLTAIMKISAFLDRLDPTTLGIIEKFQSSLFVDLQQRANEFMELSKSLTTFKAVLPRNKAIERITVDQDLAFLNPYVQEALANGASPYNPPVDLGNLDTFSYDVKADTMHKSSKSDALNFAPYQMQSSSSIGNAKLDNPTYEIDDRDFKPKEQPAEDLSSGLKLSGKVKNVWGPDGFNSNAADHKPVQAQSTYSQPDSSNGRVEDRSQMTSTASSQSQKPTKEVRKRSLTEREIMAQGLFAGLAASDTSTKRTDSPGRAPPVTTSHAPASSVPHIPAQKQPATVIDLLGADLLNLGLDSSISPSDAPTSTKPSASAFPVPGGSTSNRLSLDPLAGLSGAFSGPSQPAPPSVQPASNDILDFFGDSRPTVSSPTPVSAVLSKPSAMSSSPIPAGIPNLDPLGSLLMSPELAKPVTVPPKQHSSGLQPEVMQTPQFGSLWKQFTQEVKFQISPSSCNTPEEFSSRMQLQLNTHTVQVIGAEVICCGKSTASNQLILVHGKIRANAVDMIVKSQSPQLNASVVALLKKILL